MEHELELQLAGTKNIFDLIAICYEQLNDHIENQVLFLSEYLDNEDNPNYEELENFYNEVYELMKKYDVGMYDMVRGQIGVLIKSIKLKEYGEKELNSATVIFRLLQSIDMAAVSWDKKWICKSLGPLNSEQSNKYCVYFKLNKTLQDQVISKYGRTRSISSNIAEQFKCFRFLNKESWYRGAGIPTIKRLVIDRNLDRAYHFGNRKTLTVAAIPLANVSNFKFVKDKGSSLVVKYNKDQTEIENRAVHLLQVAIRAGANIIMFPEFVMSRSVLTKVSAQLREISLSYGRSKELMMVVAGSTWTEDNNNVMSILDSFGNVIGRYYKFSPYTKSSTESTKVFSEVEGLKNPGKECCLVSIDGVGDFLPALCRDVIDGVYTNIIAEILLPFMILVPAWSHSVASFEEKFKALANKLFTNSVLCNSCSALSVNAKNIGMASSIAKPFTTVVGQCIEYQRENCGKNCAKEGCFYKIEFNFGEVDKIVNVSQCI